jgi:superfamily II DNA or RNA helicase/dsRNA-specific ribonuclease
LTTFWLLGYSYAYQRVEIKLSKDSQIEMMESEAGESHDTTMDVEEISSAGGSDDDDGIGSSQEEESTDEDSLEELESPMYVQSSPADFLLKPPIAEKELGAISQKFKERIAVPLELFRKNGFAAYQAYELKQKEELEAQARSEESRRLESLQDAAILGSPRDYQTALFEVAKRRNTVINLGTGKGKTLIALLVIRHFAAAFEEGKQTLFIVPSVALAIQQTTTLQANLPYTVATACRTSTNAEPARRKLADANIIVATHGAIHDLLMHYEDVFQMKRFNLLILDECHYATRNHVYASIMIKWYHPLRNEERPHVLGLTASPLLNVKWTHSDEQLETMLAQLERRLDSQLVCLKDLDIDLGTNVLHKPAHEKHILYRDMQCMPPLPSCAHVGLHKSRHREFAQLDGLYSELGPLPLSIYCRTLAREVSRNDFEKESPEQFRCVVRHLLRIADYCDEQCQLCPRNGRSDKLLALEEQLEQLIEHHGGVDALGLVFVERRITALALHDFFRARQAGIKDGTWIRATRVRREQRINGNASYLGAPSTVSMIEGTPNHSMDEASGQFEDCDTDAAREYLIREADSPTYPYANPASLAQNDCVEAISGQFDDADESECTDYEMADAAKFESEVEGASFVSGQFSHAEDDDMDFDIFTNPVETRDDDADIFHNGGSIRSGVMVRRATHVFKYLTGDNRTVNGGESNYDDTWLHKEHNIREVMRQLRKHEINVLFATSIVEEGVDVQACSFVIVFDSLRSAKGYIQMKGRARQTSATFVVLQSEAEMRKGRLSLDTAQRLERRVHNFIEQRDTLIPEDPSDVAIPASFLRSNGSSAENELRAIQAGIYTAKHGSVDLVAAKGLLNKYAMAIPLDPSSRTTRESFMMHMPVYENYRLMLPSHLPAEVRLVCLPEAYRTASTAERYQMLALMACVRLHGLRLLSDRLLPLTRNDLHDELLRVAKKKISLLSTYSSQITVLFQSDQREVYLYPILQTGLRFQDNQRILMGRNRGLAMLSIERIPTDIPSMVYPHAQLGEISCSLGLVQTKRLSLAEWEECALFYATLFNGRWRRRTGKERFKPIDRSEAQGIIPPYIIGCLSSQGDLDWMHMRQITSEGARTDEELTKAASTFTGREAPRMWAPLYDPNVSYIAYGPSDLDCSAPFPDDIEGVETFQDYFATQRGHQVQKETRLFVAQRLWYLQSEALSTRKLRLSRENNREKEDQKGRAVEQTPPKHDYAVCSELGVVLLPIDACTETEVADTYMALLCAVLPQFLYHIDCNLIADAFRRHCGANLPCLGRYLERVPRSSIVEALSAKSARLETSYDRFEWLGDAVLKILQTDALLQTPELRQWVQCLHEGDLTKLRSGKYQVPQNFF